MNETTKTTETAIAGSDMLTTAIIKEHWDMVEPNYFDNNSKYIDEKGWLTTPFFKSTPKGKKLLDQNGGQFRPKTLNGCC